MHNYYYSIGNYNTAWNLVYTRKYQEQNNKHHTLYTLNVMYIHTYIEHWWAAQWATFLNSNGHLTYRGQEVTLVHVTNHCTFWTSLIWDHTWWPCAGVMLCYYCIHVKVIHGYSCGRIIYIGIQVCKFFSGKLAHVCIIISKNVNP